MTIICVYFLSQNYILNMKLVWKIKLKWFIQKRLSESGWMKYRVPSDHPSGWMSWCCYTDHLWTIRLRSRRWFNLCIGQGIFLPWLRDSTAQTLDPYLHVHKRSSLASDHCRFGCCQMTLVPGDPYANSFNIEENWKGHHETDHTDSNGWIRERKHEDSLCYPCSWLISWKETMSPVSLMKFLSQQTMISSISGRRARSQQLLIVLFVIQTVRRHFAMMPLGPDLCDRYDLVSLPSKQIKLSV